MLTTTVVGPITGKVVMPVTGSIGAGTGIPSNVVTVGGIPVTVSGVVVTSS